MAGLSESPNDLSGGVSASLDPPPPPSLPPPYRDLDCRADSGGAENSLLQYPPRVLAAVGAPNRVVALLVLSKAVVRKAIVMQQEMAVQRAVDSCCRWGRGGRGGSGCGNEGGWIHNHLDLGWIYT